MKAKSKTAADIEALARELGEAAIKVIGGIMEQGGRGDATRLRAAEVLLDRGFGKARRKPAREHPPVAPIGRIVRVIVDPVRDKQAGKKAAGTAKAIRKAESDN